MGEAIMGDLKGKIGVWRISIFLTLGAQTNWVIGQIFVPGRVFLTPFQRGVFNNIGAVRGKGWGP